MSAKLISVNRGQGQCEHCGRKIALLCTVLVDDKPMIVGSSCVEKFVPELSFQVNSKLNIILSIERKEKKRLIKEQRISLARSEFLAKIQGSDVQGENLVKLTLDDEQYNQGLVNILLDQGFTITENPLIYQAPSAEIAEKASETFEGVAMVESVNPQFLNALNFLNSYNGTFEFFNSLKSFYLLKGYLTEGQLNALVKCLDKQKPSNPIPCSGTITVSNFIAESLRHQFNLDKTYHNFNVINILRETEKAYFLELEATGKPTTRCSICGLTLTNEESVNRGIGPICAEKLGVFHWSEIKTKALKFSAWIPKRSIKDKVNFPN